MTRIKCVLPLLVFVLAMSIAGCQRSKQRTTRDLEKAKEILVVALDTWKSGTIADLATRQPPIRFSDDDYVDGWQLTSYSIEENILPTGPVNDIRVMIDLRNRQGKTTNKVATYQVTLGIPLAVLRSDN